MTITHVSQGDSIRQALTARTWNSFVDAANYHKMHTQRGTRSVYALDERPSHTVMVRNESGSAVNYGAVLEITGPIITPADGLVSFQDRSGWTVEEPTTCGKFVIAAHAIPDGSIGLAYSGGIVSVQVDRSQDWIDWCDSEAGESGHLVAMPEGTAQILWRESGTGVKWAAVRFGVPRNVALLGKASGNITAGSTGNVDVWRNGANTSYQIEAKLDWMDGGQQVSTGKEVEITWFAYEKQWRITGAECES